MSANTPTNHELIGRMYDAYNDRDLDGLTALVGDDVDWPDGDERLHGRAAVRNYWSHQWARIHTQDKVAGITDLAPGRAAIRISQIIHDLDGVIVHRRVRARLPVQGRAGRTYGPAGSCDFTNE